MEFCWTEVWPVEPVLPVGVQLALKQHATKYVGPFIGRFFFFDKYSIGLKMYFPYFLNNIFSFFKILFIHERQRQRHRQKEKQAPCRESNLGLDPRTPGSQPEPEADAQPLSHPGAPRPSFKEKYLATGLFYLEILGLFSFSTFFQI